MRATGEARSARRKDEGRHLRLLLVEDSPDDALFILRELRRGGYAVSHERVETAQGMLAALESAEWDLVISDHAMPNFSAPAALELLRFGGWPDLPFVIVSGHIGEDAAVKIMKAGAQDYVSKDNLARLAPAVERELEDAEERRQRRHAQEALKTAEEKYRGIFENAVEGIFQSSIDGRLVTANPMMARIFGHDSPEELIAAAHDISGRGYVEPAMREEFTRRLEHEGKVFEFEARLYRKDRSVIWVSINARAIRSGSEEVIGFEGTLEDITERKEAEAELRRSLDRLVALHEAGIMLGSTLEPEEIGTRLLEIMRRISGLTAAAISIRDGEYGPVEVWRSIGLEEPSLKVRKTPRVREAIESALHGEVIRVFALDDPGSGFATGIYLPLMVRERAVGVLEVYGPRDLAEAGTVSIFESLAGQAASAFENARLYGELMEREKKLQELVGKILVAQEEERRRVAYEVHDGLAQVASAAHQHLQAFAHYHPPATDEGREDLERVANLVRQTVGEARQVIADLRPTALDEFGLRSAIRLHLDALRADGWRIAYEDSLGDGRLPAVIETAIFRVVQEALNNVGKHAETTRVNVSLVRRPAGPLEPGERASIQLRIRDYGRGFVPVEGTGGGRGERVGMVGMRERITLLGGGFQVVSRPDVGTLVHAEIPLLGDPNGKTVVDVLSRPAST